MCIALTTEEEGADDNHLLMNKVVRRNLRVRMGDTVSVHPCPNDVPNCTKVHVLPSLTLWRASQETSHRRT